MKISIYELLGLIKDGKAPKRIKFDSYLWDYDQDVKDYSNTCSYLFADIMVDCEDMETFLTDEVEIIEEDNKIKKLDIEENAINRNERHIRKENHKFVSLSVADYELAIKVNELIDEINKLKEIK